MENFIILLEEKRVKKKKRKKNKITENRTLHNLFKANCFEWEREGEMALWDLQHLRDMNKNIYIKEIKLAKIKDRKTETQIQIP